MKLVLGMLIGLGIGLLFHDTPYMVGGPVSSYGAISGIVPFIQGRL